MWGEGGKGAGFSRTRPPGVGRGLRGWGMFGTPPPLGIPPDLGPPKLPRGEGFPSGDAPAPMTSHPAWGTPSPRLSPAPKANQPPGPLQWGRGQPKRGSAPFFVGDWTPRLLLVYSTLDGAAPRLLQWYSGITPASGMWGGGVQRYPGLPRGYSEFTPRLLLVLQGYTGYSRVTPWLLWVLQSCSTVTLRSL